MGAKLLSNGWIITIVIVERNVMIVHANKAFRLSLIFHNIL
jgi:hypothetical protein